jgi:hypothetical protein
VNPALHFGPPYSVFSKSVRISASPEAGSELEEPLPDAPAVSFGVVEQADIKAARKIDNKIL